MPKRCKSIARQRMEIGPGELIIPGCELLEGSGIFNGKEEWSPQFTNVQGIAGDEGAIVIWPETGNDLMEYENGENVPIGTALHKGSVLEDGVIKHAPYTTQKDSTAINDLSNGSSNDTSSTSGEVSDYLAGGINDFNDTSSTSGEVSDGDFKGFCVGSGNVNIPTDEEKDWLMKLSNLEIPDLEAWMLSGFTAKIQEMMGKLNQVLGKLNAEVDKIMSRAIIDPEDVCTPPVKALIANLLNVMAAIMKIIPVLKQIIKVVKIIQKVIKLVRKILKWTPPFIVPIVEKLLEVLNIMGLVDMVVSMLLKTVGRFSTILPLLQAQLMSILAQCAAQAGQDMTDKEACEASGGTWISPEDLKELEDMYNKISEEVGGIGDIDESVGVCSISQYLTEEECLANGGVWTDLDADTDFDKTDTSAYTKELGKQMEELDRCFSDDNLREYLEGF